jgi:uncharacterized protein
MKRFVIAATLCLAFSGSVLAQQTADSPPSKEDVDRYFQVIHSQETLKQTLNAVSKSMHQMVHDLYMKDQDKLPPDFETRMNKMMDDMWNGMPLDEMLQAMKPAYQKHFTKGDLDALLAFYSSPTGQKVLRELPAITGEAMESMMPIMQRYMETMRQRLQQETAAALKESPKSPGQSPAAPSN